MLGSLACLEVNSLKSILCEVLGVWVLELNFHGQIPPPAPAIYMTLGNTQDLSFLMYKIRDHTSKISMNEVLGKVLRIMPGMKTAVNDCEFIVRYNFYYHTVVRLQRSVHFSYYNLYFFAKARLS